MICRLDDPVADCKTLTTLVAGVVTTADVDAFCADEFRMVAVERTPVVFVDVIIVALVDIDAPVRAGGGLDLNAVIVIPPLEGVEVVAVDPVVDLLSAEEGVIGSITKLLVLDATDTGVDFPFTDGITCKEGPKVVTTLTVGGVEIIPGLFFGSGVNPLKLAKISATFLRST